MPKNNAKKIAIVGAGMAGLTCARILYDHAQVTMFEKSRNPGGRMATRTSGDYQFDHGAQYFTARSTEFQEFLEPFISDRTVQRWNARFVEINRKKIQSKVNWEDEEPRFVAVPGMRSLLEKVSLNQPVNTQAKIASIEQREHWTLIDETGKSFDGFDWVITTIPSHQATSLLPESFEFHGAIKHITMEPCFALMLGLRTEQSFPFDAARVKGSNLAWISINNTKPGRQKATSLVVHSSEEFAKQHRDREPEEILDAQLSQLSNIIDFDTDGIEYKSLHRWLYANNSDHGDHGVFVDASSRIAACGDWTQGGRVEGAFLSAFKTSQKLLEHL